MKDIVMNETIVSDTTTAIDFEELKQSIGLKKNLSPEEKVAAEQLLMQLSKLQEENEKLKGQRSRAHVLGDLPVPAVDHVGFHSPRETSVQSRIQGAAPLQGYSCTPRVRVDDTTAFDLPYSNVVFSPELGGNSRLIPRRFNTNNQRSNQYAWYVRGEAFKGAHKPAGPGQEAMPLSWVELAAGRFVEEWIEAECPDGFYREYQASDFDDVDVSAFQTEAQAPAMDPKTRLALAKAGKLNERPSLDGQAPPNIPAKLAGSIIAQRGNLNSQ